MRGEAVRAEPLHEVVRLAVELQAVVEARELVCPSREVPPEGGEARVELRGVEASVGRDVEGGEKRVGVGEPAPDVLEEVHGGAFLCVGRVRLA